MKCFSEVSACPFCWPPWARRLTPSSVLPAAWLRGSGETVTTDFNHDGKIDLASADADRASAATETARSRQPSDLGFSGTHIATADFNGDGKPDILLDTMVFLGNGDGTFQAPLTTIAATKRVRYSGRRRERRPQA